MAITAALLAGCGDRGTEPSITTGASGVGAARHDLTTDHETLMTLLPDSVREAMEADALTQIGTEQAVCLVNSQQVTTDLALMEAAVSQFGCWVHCSDEGLVYGVWCIPADTTAATLSQIVALVAANGDSVWAAYGSGLEVAFPNERAVASLHSMSELRSLNIPGRVSGYARRTDLFETVTVLVSRPADRN